MSRELRKLFRTDFEVLLDKGQKQSFRGLLKKSCSENMQQIYRRTPMLKCDFNHTLTWVFSCKFAAYFQNIFFWEHLLRAVPEKTWAHSKGYCIGTFKFDVNLKVHQKCKTVLNAQNLGKSMSSLVHVHQQMKRTLRMPIIHELKENKKDAKPYHIAN